MDFFNKSKIRARILTLFFSNENSEFYLSDIAKRAGTSGGTCQRELEKLTKMGVLEKYKKYNLSFYKTNSSSPYFREIKALFNKTIGIPGIIKKTLTEIEGIEFAFIFGSYARSGANEGDGFHSRSNASTRDSINSESDIDLFIVGNPSELALLQKIKEAEELIGREIDYSIYSLTEFEKGLKSNPFVKETVKNFILLKGNEDEFKGLLRKTGSRRTFKKAKS